MMVVALISEEWWYSSGSTQSIVIQELSKGQEFRPIILLIGTINPEVLLEGMVHSFSLAVTFWVVPGSEVESDVEGLTEGLEEVWDKLWTSVGSDVEGNSVFREYVEEEELCELGRCYCVVGQDEYALFW